VRRAAIVALALAATALLSFDATWLLLERYGPR